MDKGKLPKISFKLLLFKLFILAIGVEENAIDKVFSLFYCDPWDLSLKQKNVGLAAIYFFLMVSLLSFTLHNAEKLPRKVC